MSKAVNLAKLTFAFVVIAGGFSIILGSLMGGGLSSSYDRVKGHNNDPRSIFVQAILLETNGAPAESITLPNPGQQLNNTAFATLLDTANELRDSENARVKTPSMLIQHRETGSINITLGNRTFDATISPSVIDTKQGPVLRAAIQIQRIDTDSFAEEHELTFTTAFTSAPGSAVVLDLADLGLQGTRSVLALHTTLIDPTPVDD